jgi:hypothetical protein
VKSGFLASVADGAKVLFSVTFLAMAWAVALTIFLALSVVSSAIVSSILVGEAVRERSSIFMKRYFGHRKSS